MNLMKSGLEKELDGGVSRTPRGWDKVEIIPSVYLSFCLLVTTKVMTLPSKGMGRQILLMKPSETNSIRCSIAGDLQRVGGQTDR